MKSTFKVMLVIGLLMASACSTTKKKTETPVSAASEEDDTPSITKPKIKSFVVPDTIEGNKYIKSHRVYILEDAGSWSK